MAKSKLQDIKCLQCWKLFHPKNSTTKFCCKKCYSLSLTLLNKKCPICWNVFHPKKSNTIYCSNKCYLQSHKIKSILCKQCWKKFMPTHSGQIYCSRECQRASLRTLKNRICLYCWKEFKPRHSKNVYCSRVCQYKSKSENNKIRWNSLSEEEKNKIIKPLFDYSNLDNVSKINIKYKEYLEWLWFNVELEKKLWRWAYDLCVWNTLIDINPFAYHNVTRHPYNKPRDKMYHYNKLKMAKDNWYKCIMVWDWDKKEDIANLLNDNKIVIWARKCNIMQISYEDCHLFLENNHIQWDTRKNKNNIYIWLFYNDKLIEVMSFWKPRQNKNYEREILRLCTLKWYSVIWGASKIFKFFIELTGANKIISYCDMSKFNWEVYLQLWFKLLKWNQPSKHWYNWKLKQHITDWLIRQYWYDKLFKTNYWKWVSNDELMKQAWYVEIYDCWQATYIYNKKSYSKKLKFYNLIIVKCLLRERKKF